MEMENSLTQHQTKQLQQLMPQEKVTVKGPGVAKITVKAAATTDYKAASKTVTVTVAPKKQSISLINKIKKQLTIKWKKNTKASGYQVVYSTNKKFTGKKTVRKAKTTTSYKIKGLKKGKKYYVKVRSYKTVNGKRIYGAYSTAKKQQSNRDDKELVS